MVPAPLLMGHRSVAGDERPRRNSGEPHESTLQSTGESEERRVRLVCSPRTRREQRRDEARSDGAGIDEEVAAAGVGEDDDCGRTEAPGSDSLDEEQQDVEAKLPVLSDPSLVAGDDGNDGEQ